MTGRWLRAGLVAAVGAGLVARERHRMQARTAGLVAEVEVLRSENDRLLAERANRAGGSGAELFTDPETGLLGETYFHVALDARIASARRHLRPVSIALVEIEGGAGRGEATSTAEPRSAADGGPEGEILGQVTGSIRSTLRHADTACRLADGTFALILEDTPESGAVWTVERLRRDMVERHGPRTVRAGIACYPAHAFDAHAMLERAQAALVSARDWNQDRIEVATVD